MEPSPETGGAAGAVGGWAKSLSTCTRRRNHVLHTEQAERETTKKLSSTQRLCRHAGINSNHKHEVRTPAVPPSYLSLSLSLSLSLLPISLSLVFLSHNEAAELPERRVQQTAGPLLISPPLSRSLSLYLSLSLSLPAQKVGIRTTSASLVLCFGTEPKSYVTDPPSNIAPVRSAVPLAANVIQQDAHHTAVPLAGQRTFPKASEAKAQKGSAQAKTNLTTSTDPTSGRCCCCCPSQLGRNSCS